MAYLTCSDSVLLGSNYFLGFWRTAPREIKFEQTGGTVPSTYLVITSRPIIKSSVNNERNLIPSFEGGGRKFCNVTWSNALDKFEFIWIRSEYCIRPKKDFLLAWLKCLTRNWLYFFPQSSLQSKNASCFFACGFLSLSYFLPVSAKNKFLVILSPKAGRRNTSLSSRH